MSHMQLHSWNIYSENIREFCLLLFCGGHATRMVWAKAESMFMDVRETAWWRGSVSVPLRGEQSFSGFAVAYYPWWGREEISAQFLEDKNEAPRSDGFAGRKWALEARTGHRAPLQEPCSLSILKCFRTLASSQVLEGKSSENHS